MNKITLVVLYLFISFFKVLCIIVTLHSHRSGCYPAAKYKRVNSLLFTVFLNEPFVNVVFCNYVLNKLFQSVIKEIFQALHHKTLFQTVPEIL